MTDKYTKIIDVHSCIIAERHDDKHMILTLSTKVGSFEFAFSPLQWQRLGETAGWFEFQQQEPSKGDQ